MVVSVQPHFLVSATLLCFAACKGEERVLLPRANAALKDAAAEQVSPQQARDGSAAVQGIAHDVLPIALGDGAGSVHRLRVPLARARFELVDLGFRTPVIHALADRDLIFNGGYWAYRGKQRVIEGLVLVNDHLYSHQNRNLNGGVFEVRGGRARMLRSADYVAQPNTQLAVQCSPRLVVSSTVVPKLDRTRRAARTALCVESDGASLTVFLTDHGTKPTLLELAELLVRSGCIDALNLDGGPSTAAAFRAVHGVAQVGVGEELPYALGVRLTAR